MNFMLAGTATAVRRLGADEGIKGAKSEIWQYISNHVPRSRASFSADFGGRAGVMLRRITTTAYKDAGETLGRNVSAPHLTGQPVRRGFRPVCLRRQRSSSNLKPTAQRANGPTEPRRFRHSSSSLQCSYRRRCMCHQPRAKSVRCGEVEAVSLAAILAN
jgi:hypothetical protein